jgi:hypothetical protein
LVLIYVALVATSFSVINATEARLRFYVFALLWPWIVLGLADVLIIAVPLLAVPMDYRYGYVSYEAAVALALAFPAGGVYLAWRYR